MSPCRRAGLTSLALHAAGVAADSDPAAEYHETLNKAMGLLRAIELAETQL